ncbi:AI-2E family transporter [Salibacterium halotolerans]|uniref:Predicted PurR-regulated permease PerM n=1 Tax=Salibacterium halotolerans TaxID=1884432 RepID=A0A1I5UCU8_9BACI|nr:AI-2E family transporter [Salibacterium halotolerans]SFP93074.1 Predicted PurR-regulated permease PerM [Salibacterium halotolerans]
MTREEGQIWTQRLVILLLIFVLIYFLYLLHPVWIPVLGMAGRVLLPFLAASVIAYLLHPLIDVLHKWHVPRPLAILSVYILFFGGGIWLVWYYSPVMIQEMQRFVRSIPFYMDQVYEWTTMLHRRVDMLPPGVHDHIEMSFQETQKRAVDSIRGLAGRWKDVLDAAIMMILLPFLVFYFVKDYRAFQKFVKRVTPVRWRDEAHLLAVSIDEALGSYIRGQFIVAGTVGLLSTLALFWMDVPSALILGLFIGLTDIIPYFGPILGAIPAVIAAGTVSVNKAVLTAAVLFIIQQIEGNLLSPYIVGRNVHIHPLMIVFALLLGFEAAGVIGLLLAVPLFVVVHHVIAVFHSHRNRKKNED